MKEIMLGEIPDSYLTLLEDKAKEYRAATTKILSEAGYRRSPSFTIAKEASRIAVKNYWEATSNMSLGNQIPKKLIVGTMAHSFIMRFKNEITAFRVWNKYFPNSIFLIDTYDSIKAVKKIIKAKLKPSAVRIDSDPIEKIAIKVRKLLDKAGWTDVKIFLSGDITPEKLIKWEKENIPFDMCMVGTKYVNLGVMANVNCGFVYKIVEFTTIKNGETTKMYPEKKAKFKSNYPGLKKITVNDNGDILMKITRKKDDFGFENMEKINSYAKVKFVRRG